MDLAPNLPKPSQCVLRRLEIPVSVHEAPTSFLSLTRGSDKAGVFCPHGPIPIFPKVYTGGHEEVSVLLCPCGPKSSRSITEGSEEAGAPVTMNAHELPEASTYVLRGLRAPATVGVAPQFLKPPCRS